MKEVLSSVKTLDELRSEIKTPEEAVCAGMLIGEECVKMKRGGNPDFVSVSVINEMLDLAINGCTSTLDILRSTKDADTATCIKKVMGGRSLEEAKDDLLIFGITVTSINEIRILEKYGNGNFFENIAKLFTAIKNDDEYKLLSKDDKDKVNLIKLGIIIAEDVDSNTFTPVLMAAFMKALNIDNGKIEKKLKGIDSEISDLDELIKYVGSDNPKEMVTSLIMVGFIIRKNHSQHG